MENQNPETTINLEAKKPAPEQPPRRQNNKPDHKMRNIFLIIIGAVVLISAAIIITLLLTRSDEQEVEVVEETVVEEEEETLLNSPLQAGSVTTTIDGKSITYNAAYVVDGIEATIGSGTYEAKEDNQAVFLVINGGSLKIEGDVVIDKTGSEDFQGRGDDYSFYGTNSAIVVVGENSKAEISGVTLSTMVSGANAVVATNGGSVEIKNSKISTTSDNSRGLHATYQGTISAKDTEISTLGASCAALATDRGEGTVTAENMTMETSGAGSPLIYSTGKITVKNSKGTAIGAQIAVVEGKNSISLEGCDFSTYGIGNRNGVDNAGVMIYQSMSGDAGEGTGSFSATGCKLTIMQDSAVYESTPFFFVTNTTAAISLVNTTIDFSETQKFISAKGTSEWGRSGRNGGTVNLSVSGLTATNENVETDSISIVRKV